MKFKSLALLLVLPIGLSLLLGCTSSEEKNQNKEYTYNLSVKKSASNGTDFSYQTKTFEMTLGHLMDKIQNQEKNFSYRTKIIGSGPDAVVVDIMDVIVTASKDWKLYINDEETHYSETLKIKPNNKVEWIYE